MPPQKVWHERFWIFLFFSILFLFFEYFISQFSSLQKIRGKKLVPWLTVFIVIFLGAEKASLANRDEATKAFKDRNYEKAAKAFLDAEIDEPENFTHSYNTFLPSSGNSISEIPYVDLSE